MRLTDRQRQTHRQTDRQTERDRERDREWQVSFLDGHYLSSGGKAALLERQTD